MPHSIFNTTYSLVKGEYRVKVAWNNSSSQITSIAYVDLTWDGPEAPGPMDENTDFKVGGLRIAKIVDSDGATGQDIVRWFDYNYDETDLAEVPVQGSSGTFQNTPLYSYLGIISVPVSYQGNIVYTTVNTLILTSFSNSSILQTSGGYVGYKKVAVTYGADKKGGKQVSYFSSAADHPDGNLTLTRWWPQFYEPVDVDWRRGLNKKVVDFKYEYNTYTPVRESKKEFTFLTQQADPNNYQQANVRISPTSGGAAVPTVYKTVSESFYMSESTDSLDAIITTTTFEQNSLNLAVSKTTTNNSKGDQIQVITKYPVDYGNVENMTALKTANIVSLPVKTETTSNNKLVNGVVVKYTDLGQPKDVYRYENSNLVDPSIHSNTVIVPSNYSLKMHFSYSGIGSKLTETKPTNNFPTAYIWGYGRSFPVAKIENIEAGQLPTSVVSEIEAYTFTGGTQVTDFQTDVDFLNTKLSTLRANKSYKVTSYTYNTAFGLTSQTDANGITTYFESDGHGRLKHVKDNDKNITQAIKYHYKGQ